ncbi:hypothetical protein M378DRAFT_171830, partial [Amanita muscaria Koide BX008]
MEFERHVKDLLCSQSLELTPSSLTCSFLGFSLYHMALLMAPGSETILMADTLNSCSGVLLQYFGLLTSLSIIPLELEDYAKKFSHLLVNLEKRMAPQSACKLLGLYCKYSSA